MIPMAKPRILLADDHVSLLRSLGRLLQDDCEVLGYATTVEGLVAEVRGCHPDIVVVDLNMPDANGIDACQRLKLAQPDIKIVMLTAEDDFHVRAAALDAGASDFVPKSAIERLLPAIWNVWPKPAN